MSALDMIVYGINSIVVLNCEYLFHNNIVVYYLRAYIAIWFNFITYFRIFIFDYGKRSIQLVEFSRAWLFALKLRIHAFHLGAH